MALILKKMNIINYVILSLIFISINIELIGLYLVNKNKYIKFLLLNRINILLNF